MTEESYLNPAVMREQCALAVRNLEKDNETLHIAEERLCLFLEDEEIKGDAFDTLKQQISDYKMILQAMRSANDSDIADFRTLSGAVGEEILDGRNILSQERNALSAGYQAEDHAHDYAEKANQTPYPWMEMYYRTKAGDYQRLAENYRKVYERWKEKETAYDSIDAVTGELFCSSTETRQAARSALESTGRAFVDGCYRPDMGAAWRQDLSSCYVNRVLSISKEGEIVINWREVEKILGKEAGDITPQEYDVIALVYLNADEEDLGRILQLLMGERRDDPGIYTPAERERLGMASQSYSEWTIDQEKLVALEVRLQISSEVALYQIQQKRAQQEEEAASGLISQRNIMLQRLTLLEVMGQIQRFRKLSMEGYSDNGEYPDITVSGDEKGNLTVKFCEYRDISPIGVPIMCNVGVSTVIIGETLPGFRIDDKAIKNAKYNLASHFGGYSPSGEAAAFAVEEYVGMQAEAASKRLAEYAAKEMGKEFLGGLIRCVPLMDIAGLGLDVLQGTAQEEEDMEFIEDQFRVLEDADIYDEFDCYANLVEYDVHADMDHVIFAYPGERTDEIISRLNESFGLSLSRWLVIENPDKVRQIKEAICEDSMLGEEYGIIIDNK